jgi:hypothetical protein
VRAARTRKSDDVAAEMAAFVSMFNSIEDAVAFERAALGTPNVHLPPIARAVRDGGPRTTLYWRWLTISAEVWT